jgi:multidrug resistance efflux pump
MIERSGDTDTPFAYGDYDLPPSRLPKARSPAWTGVVLWLSVFGLVVFGWLALNGSIDEYVTVSGEVRPKDYTIIFSTVTGILHEVVVDEGDVVAKGDIVARLWLLPEKFAFDPQRLRLHEIRSPESGRVSSKTRLSRGERVFFGAPMVKLVRSEERELQLYTTEDRIDRIQVGQVVRFRAKSNPDRLAPPGLGRVVSLARDKDLEVNESSLKKEPTYTVTASVEFSGYELPLGSRVEAEIILGKRYFWKILLLKLQQQ